MAIDKKACNALLLKVNQIGSLTESIQALVFSFFLKKKLKLKLNETPI